MFKFQQFRDAGLALLLLLTSATAWSQASGYSFAQSSTTYTAITGGTVVATGTIDDTSYPALPIGFTFNYNGADYTTFSLNANGQIAMGSAITYSYTPISDGFASNNMIAAYGDDLQGLTNGEMRYQTIGSAPNRTLVMQFANWRHYNTTGDNINFQIRLNETTNTVQVVYGAFVRNTTAQTTEVGLRGGSNADYNNRSSATDWSLTVAGTANNASITSNSTIIPASGLTFTWTPPSCLAPGGLSFAGLSATSATVSWAALSSGTPTNGYDWQVVPGGNAQGVGVIASGNTTTTSGIATGLTSNTSYTLYVRSNCGGVQSAYTSYTFFFCGTTAPGNGQANAIVATTPSFTYNFSGSNWACYNNNYTTRAPVDVYFQFVADSCASSITVSTCNTVTGWDNYMTILASNGTTVIGTADDVCGALASYTFTPAAGATYYAVVEPYSTFTTPADFRLDITQTTGTPASTLTTTNVGTSCPGSTNGTATVSALGGKKPFTYAWSNGVTQTIHATSSTITGLAAGTYTVTVTNNCGGTSTASTTVSSSFSFTGTATPTSCNGTSDGAVDLTLTGAITPTFVWSNAATTEDLAGLVAGTYNVTITSGTCVATATYAVTQPPLGVAAVSNSTTCGGTTVTLSLTGQSAGSPFVWQSSANGTTAWTNVPGGTVTPFQVSPADTTYYRAFFCGSTPTNVVVVNAYVVNSPVASNVTRCGPGSVTVTAAGSNIRWYDSAAGTTSLATGASYTTNITTTTTFYAEASGGGSTSNIGPLDNTIGTGAQQQSTNYLIFDALQAFTLQSVVVFPATTGNVVVNLQTSTGTVLQTLTYNIATLPASGGVTVPLNFSVPVGTGLQLAQGAGSISMFRNDGGVTYPYTVPGYASITNSAAGNTYYYFFYNWSITTACTSPRTPVTATVTTPPAITVAAGLPAVCAGSTTTLTATSPNLGYAYTWAPAASLSSATGASVTASPTASTVYSVTASDANSGCQATANVSVGVNPLPNVTASATPSAVCPGATVTLNGVGTSNFAVGTGTVQNTTTTYPAPYGNWYWGAKNQMLITAAELQAAGIGAGNINGLIFDVVSTNGVPLVDFEIQMAPTALTALTTTFVATGFTIVSPAVTYTPIVGANTHNFTTPFNWDGISNIVVQTCFFNGSYTNNAVFNQTATSYASSVYINQDVTNSCPATAGFNTANQRPNMTFITTPSYSYAWTPSAGLANANAATTTVTPTATGTYTFAVTNNATGCSATASTTVTVFPLPTVTATSTSILCNGAANGTATATAVSGTAPYTYAWSNGGTTASITGLSGGTYTVSVTDANNCVTATATVTVTEPTALSLDAAILTPVSCFGGSNGAIDIAISGGVAPYTYAWSTGATTQDVNGLVAGSYSGTITDANGCTLIVGPAIVTEPAVLALTAAVTNVTCNGAANGAIDITVTGGTTPYNYAWSNGAVSQDISALAPGVYSGTITDANGCTVVGGPVTITEPAVLAIASATVTNVTCFGAANGAIDITVSGGTAPYTYAWSDGSTTEDLANLVPGIYTGTITDANGCTVVGGPITITEPTLLSVSPDVVENVSCNGSNDGRIVTMVNGGTLPYSFIWSNGATTQNLTGLAPGTYDVTVTDANACTAVLIGTIITEPTAIVITAAVTNVSCNGGTNGAVDLTVTGGVPAYTYAWSNSATSEDLTGLVAGAYDVTVTDATGCSVTLSNTVAQPAIALQLGGLPTITNVTCNGLCNGGLSNVVIVGGTTPYNYSWVGPNGFTANTANLSNLCAGTYNGTVTDANGCTYTPPVALSITQPDALVVTLTPTAASSSVGATDGSVASLVSGGVPAYTYLWSNAVTTANLTGVAADTYTVSVTDTNGCVATAVTTVGPPTGVVNVEGVNNFNMFPNPTAGNVTITFDLATAQNVEMSIFNVNGQLVKYAESGAQSNIMFNLDLSSFTGGVYMARFTVGGETFTKQIVLVK